MATTNWIGEDKITAECDYSVVDVATDSTTVYTGECTLHGFYVNTVLSAHTNIFKDGSTSVITTVASLAAGSLVQFNPGIRFFTSLVFDPNDSATGNITIMYKPMRPPASAR